MASLSKSGINSHALASALVLHAVVLICWVAYSFYQPVIFEDFGLKNLTDIYRSIQNILLVIIPILSGYLTDKYFNDRRKTLISLMLGVMVTACLFLSLAGIFLSKAEQILPIIPILMLFWVISMNMFYNPGLAILAQNARESGWAYASAVTGSVTDITFAIIGYLIVFFRSLGHSFTFGAGAILVLGAAYYFYRNHANQDFKTIATATDANGLKYKIMLRALVVGVGLGFVHYKILHHLANHLYGVNGNIIIPVLMVLCAICLLKVHNHLHHYGLIKVFITGFILCLVAFVMLSQIHTLGGTIIGLMVLIPGILFVSGTAFGAALDKVPSAWSNFGTGIFLAGFNSMIYMMG